MGDPAESSRPESQVKLGRSRWAQAIQEPAPAKGTRGLKKGAIINKTQEIRALAREAIDEGFRPRPTEIAAELMRRKQIEVSGPQVSMALRGTGMEFRRPKEPQPAASFGTLPAEATAISQVSVEDLLLVREFIKKVGSLDKALAAVIAYRHLGMERVKREGDA